jgi:hypothetical protein
MRAAADEADMAAETPKLTVMCPLCSEAFASALQIDPDTWLGINFHRGLVERCSHCGRASRFSKGDYTFND